MTLTLVTTILSILGIISSYSNLTHIMALEPDEQSDGKIFSTASIDDDFSRDTVLVILNKTATMSFKKYTKDDFPELQCHDVIDLTWQTTELIKQQITAMKSGNWKTLQSHKDSSMLVDIPSFRRILSLKINLSDKLETYKDVKTIRQDKLKVLESISKLEKRDDIIYVGPNRVYESQRVPNDPQYVNGNQWAINNINLPAAWDITTGSNSVRIGVIDTGIHGNHQDLTNQLNNNLHRDFRNATTTIISTPFDTSTHGTHVAGIIGAESNTTPANGITGVVWNSSLVCLIIDENGCWYSDNATLAVDHATANNIQILNYSGRVRDRSGNVNVDDPAFRQAITNYPGLFVAAAGNEGKNNDVNHTFPANYANVLNNVISVGAINSGNHRADFSNYGTNTVSIYAPGVNILSTVPGANSYDNYNGTSMAAPFVTGVAALIRAILPNVSATELRDFILDNADNITISTPSGSQNVLKLNAGEAVKNASFVTSSGGSTIAVRQTTNVVLKDVIIPTQINGITITTLKDSAFSNQTQLIKASLPNSITTIGNKAFYNTNNAPIYLLNRTSAPSTFHYNWNASLNPVYLSDGLCTHTSKTLTNLSGTKHGMVCNKCRTTTNIENHDNTYTWINYTQHNAECDCGYDVLEGHSVSSTDPGFPYKTCLKCGGPASTGFVWSNGYAYSPLGLANDVVEYFGNGSYLLANGVYVISDADLDAFYEGTLVLPEISAARKNAHHSECSCNYC